MYSETTIIPRCLGFERTSALGLFSESASEADMLRSWGVLAAATLGSETMPGNRWCPCWAATG